MTLFGDKGDKMKGKTIIQLKDVKTGAIQKVEHSNTFQNAVLEDLFRPMGALRMSMVSGNANQWQSLLGGILVFDDTIEVGTKYPPKGVNMVANGAYGVTNNSDPVEMGTWNETESSVTKDEIVMTYDFSTAQGNGHINSVCLTHYNAGYAGVGNASMTVKDLDAVRPPYLGEYGNLPPYYPYIDNNYMYWFDKSENTLTVYKRWLNKSGIDIIKGWNTNSYDESFTITIPSAYASTGSDRMSETKIAFIKDNSSNYTAVVVDLSTRSVSSEITIPRLGSGGVVSGSDNLLMWQIHTSEGQQYLSIYDTNAGQWIDDIALNVPPNVSDAGGFNISRVKVIGGRYYVRAGIWSTGQSSVWNSRNIWCARNNVLVPSNLKEETSNGYGYEAYYLPNMDIMQIGAGYYMERVQQFAHVPFYLATINNLEEEIVKDNTKTMKITYVLTRR